MSQLTESHSVKEPLMRIYFDRTQDPFATHMATMVAFGSVNAFEQPIELLRVHTIDGKLAADYALQDNSPTALDRIARALKARSAFDNLVLQFSIASVELHNSPNQEDLRVNFSPYEPRRQPMAPHSGVQPR